LAVKAHVAGVTDATPSIEAKKRLLFKPLKPLSVA
jgi:hypothetical protein